MYHLLPENKEQFFILKRSSSAYNHMKIVARLGSFSFQFLLEFLTFVFVQRRSLILTKLPSLVILSSSLTFFTS